VDETSFIVAELLVVCSLENQSRMNDEQIVEKKMSKEQDVETLW